MAERLYRRGRIWWTWFYDERGKRFDKSTRCRDKRAASSVARRYERSAASPADPTATTTLAEACRRFQVDRRNRGRAADTLEYYATKIGHLLFVFGEERPLDDIDARAVDDYIAERLDDGVLRATVAKELGALRGVLRAARRRGEYHGDPSVVLPEGWTTGYVPRKRKLTPAEANRLLLALPVKRRPHVAFILAFAASWGESVRAERADMDLAKALVAIRGTKTATRRRVVPVMRHVRDLAKRAHAGARADGRAYERWSNVRRDIEVACTKAGLERVSPNDLRRTAATWLIERGAPSHLVAYFLGHSTSRMVEQVYGRVDGPRLAVALGAVGVPAAAFGRRSRRLLPPAWTARPDQDWSLRGPRPATGECLGVVARGAVRSARTARRRGGRGGIPPGVRRRAHGRRVVPPQ